MIKSNIALVIAAASLLASPFAVAQCASGTRLCCGSLEPFSDNANVWTNICGIQESDQSVLVGSLCEEISGTW